MKSKHCTFCNVTQSHRLWCCPGKSSKHSKWKPEHYFQWLKHYIIAKKHATLSPNVKTINTRVMAPQFLIVDKVRCFISRILWIFTFWLRFSFTFISNVFKLTKIAIMRNFSEFLVNCTNESPFLNAQRVNNKVTKKKRQNYHKFWRETTIILARRKTMLFVNMSERGVWRLLIVWTPKSMM